MGEDVQARPRAFGVNYRDLQTWNVAAQYAVQWNWPDEVIKPLASILRRRNEAALKTLTQESIVTLLTIRFDGSIEPREPVRIKDIKGRLFRVYPGDVVFSKIDVRNGAIGLAPHDIDCMCVTSEFPVYSVDFQKTDSGYVKLLFRTGAFKKLLNSMISGASGRKRIQPTQLEDVKVPIPPLSAQQKIVAHWDAAQTVLQRNLEAISLSKKEAFDTFRKALGIKTSSIARPKLFTARWVEVERWGYELAWTKKSGASSFSYPIKPLKEVCKTGSGGTPSRKHKEYYGGEIPWVKTTEVKNAVITHTEEKITQIGLSASSARRYPAGSLVIAMYGQGATRGRTAKLGMDAATNQACLVLTDIDPALDVDFLWYYLMVSYNEMRELASGNNQPNLSADLLGEFPIPIPPKTKQSELKTIFETAQKKVAQLEAQSVMTRSQMIKESEKMILGVRPLEGY
jgi:type I restriction enzyme S subunit